MGVEPLWFPGNMPSASHMVADDTAASVALAMEPDHMAMMNWWTTMETPPQTLDIRGFLQSAEAASMAATALQEFPATRRTLAQPLVVCLLSQNEQTRR
ncbi:MAG: hypothetical protein STHCBS139747_008054 [Sporothrix thermara]